MRSTVMTMATILGLALSGCGSSDVPDDSVENSQSETSIGARSPGTLSCPSAKSISTIVGSPFRLRDPGDPSVVCYYESEESINRDGGGDVPRQWVNFGHDESGNLASYRDDFAEVNVATELIPDLGPGAFVTYGGMDDYPCVVQFSVKNYSGIVSMLIGSIEDSNYTNPGSVEDCAPEIAIARMAVS